MVRRASITLLLSLLCITASYAQVTTHTDVEYAKIDTTSLTLDLYLPASSHPLPLIMYVHGGGWNSGDKIEGLLVAGNMTQYGFALASINYRLSEQAIFPAQIFDCKRALRWLRAHATEYNIDPNHIGVWGASAGGHLAALLGTSGGIKELEGTEGDTTFSSRVQAVCDWFGPTDLVKLAPEFPDSASPINMLLGGRVQDHLALAQAANPITWITPDDPPFLIQQGTADPVVPPEQSELLDSALQAAGVDVTSQYIVGAEHGGDPFNVDSVRSVVLSFFNRTLKTSASAVRGIDAQGTALSVYPNPCRGAATIHFSLDKPALAELELIDIEGRTVQKLYSAYRSQGSYDERVALEHRAALPNGEYFIVMRLNGVPVQIKGLSLLF